MSKPLTSNYWNSFISVGWCRADMGNSAAKAQGLISKWRPYWYLSATLQYLQCISNGDTAVLHKAFKYRDCHYKDNSLIFNTMRQRQNGRRFADDTFKRIFLNENVRISIKISLKFVPEGPINNNPSLVQIMAWHWSEPMMVSLLTDICGLNELMGNLIQVRASLYWNVPLELSFFALTHSYTKITLHFSKPQLQCWKH